ncbi:FAD-dependent oxidoreductase [Chloroflexota bacterium]
MNSKPGFEKLTQPGQIGKVKTKNRIVRPALSMHFATEEGYITDTNLAYYEKLAQNDVGLITVEMAAIDYPTGCPSPKNLVIDDDKFIPRLSELTKVIHRYDVPAFLQLVHCGPQHEPIQGTKPRTPSSLSMDELPVKRYGPTIELSILEIEDIVDKFAKGAERAQEAGFDGVEIHAAHMYLVACFMSRVWNKRQDRYGGSLENRARFPCEIIRAIKERVGQDFPVGIRISGAEYGIEKASTPKEVQEMCRMLQESGADYIHVSVWGYGSYNRIGTPEQVFYPEAPKPLAEGIERNRKGAGGLTLLAAGIKKAVSIPVIAVGRLEPVLAEKILRQGRADFVAFGRCLIADPEIVRKVTEGRTEDIVPCTACLQCFGAYLSNKPVVCRVNATVGKEREYELKPAGKKKRVMVVGGGPGGMEAARVAALRGHEVTLYEREPKLGWVMLIQNIIRGFVIEDLVALTRYFKIQIKKLGINVRLGKQVDEALIKEINPDVVILAIGGTPATPEIPGINGPIVVSQSRLHRMVKTYLRFLGPRILRWLTNFYLPIGKRVTIIGGGIQGIELAEFLVRRGRKVTVTETSDELGAELAEFTRDRLLPWLVEKGCTLLSGVKYEKVTDKGLTLVTREGERRTIEAASILPALPLRPNTGLFESVKEVVPEVYLIGDAREPHLIMEAIADGYRTALNI